MGRGEKLGSATLGAARADGRRVVSRYRGGRDFDRGLIGRRLFAETLRFYALYRCSAARAGAGSEAAPRPRRGGAQVGQGVPGVQH